MLALAPAQRVPARRVDTEAPQRPLAAVRASLSDLRALVGARDDSPAIEDSPASVPIAPPARQARTVQRPRIAID